MKYLNVSTSVQVKAFSLFHRNLNLLLIAPTGSGKTEAVLFPVFSTILSNRDIFPKNKYIYCIYITPLRALNRDILLRMEKIAEKLDIKVDVRHGNTLKSKRRKMLHNIPDILITAPETLQFIIAGKKLRELIRGVRWIVVDEIHELINSKRGIQLSIALERVSEISYNEPVRIGLSATISEIETAKNFLGGRRKVYEIVSKEGREVDVEVIRPTLNKECIKSSKAIDQETCSRIMEIKKYAEKYGKILIFTNTRDTAESLTVKAYLLLSQESFIHHSSLSRDERLISEKDFKSRNKRLKIIAKLL